MDGPIESKRLCNLLYILLCLANCVKHKPDAWWPVGGKGITPMFEKRAAEKRMVSEVLGA